MKKSLNDSAFLDFADEIPAIENYGDEMDEGERKGWNTRTCSALSTQELFQSINWAENGDWLDIPQDFDIQDSLNSSMVLRTDGMFENYWPGGDLLSSHRSYFSPEEIVLLTVVEKHPFYLHVMIYRKEFDMIQQLFDSQLDNKEEIIEELDHRGNTPLLLAAKLSYKNTEYIRIAALLLHHGANPRVKDADGWSIIDEAGEKRNGVLLGLVFDYMYKERTHQLQKSKKIGIKTLETLPDFYIEMKWQFDSSIIPLMSKIAPRDTWKLWKVGSNLRLDTTLAGWKNLRSKRRDLTLIFRDAEKANEQLDMILINHSKRILVNPMEPLDKEERALIIRDVMQVEPIQGDITIDSYSIAPCKTWTGKRIQKTIHNWQTQKYKIKLHAKVDYKKKGRNYLFQSEYEYFSNITGCAIKPNFIFDLPGLGQVTERDSAWLSERRTQRCNQQQAQDQAGKYIKKGSASVWMSEDFPITLSDFLPVLTTLGAGNPQILKLHEFLNGQIFTSDFSSSAFPVKVDIPLTFSIRAVITFQKFQKLGRNDLEHFKIPDYPIESRKVAQKTMTCPRKRVVIANAVI